MLRDLAHTCKERGVASEGKDSKKAELANKDYQERPRSRAATQLRERLRPRGSLGEF